QRTAGTIIVYARRPAEALYHADCGGYTAGAETVWGGSPVPYLLPTRDDVPHAAHAGTLRVPVDDLRMALNADKRSEVGKTLTELSVTRRDVGGRAAEVRVAGDRPLPPRLLRGEELRVILNQRLGDKAIQSTRFSVRLVS